MPPISQSKLLHTKMDQTKAKPPLGDDGSSLGVKKESEEEKICRYERVIE